MYTSATGMIMNQHRMDVIANNLANNDKTGFKADDAIYKSFPEMLLQRTREDGMGHVPMGSFDLAPTIGRLGTGVEVNEVFTRFEQGAVKKTGNHFDLMLDGSGQQAPGFMMVLTDRGERLTRSGSFVLNKDGQLTTPQGFPLMGEKGPIEVARWNFVVKENGEVWINQTLGNDPKVGANETFNRWENPVLLDKIKLRSVEFPRHLAKEGDSFYADTPESGPPVEFLPGKGPRVLQGFLEASNVNLVKEMVEMIEVQRSYEANQKSVSTQDALLGKLINEVIR